MFLIFLIYKMLGMCHCHAVRKEPTIFIEKLANTYITLSFLIYSTLYSLQYELGIGERGPVFCCVFYYYTWYGEVGTASVSGYMQDAFESIVAE